jgi:transposase-like protein
MAEQQPFKWRHFEAEIILVCVRWYLRYALSYRDLEELMRERGLSVDHTTISRWVQRYAPELEKRCRPHLRRTTDSWRVDETYVKGATRTWTLTLPEAKEVCTLVGFGPSPQRPDGYRRSRRVSNRW